MARLTSAQRQKILSGSGRELRQLANSMLADPDHLPGKTELRKQVAAVLEALNAPESADQRLYDTLVKYAERAKDRRARFTLRQEVDELVIAMVTKLEDDDRLVAVEDEEPIDVASIADDVSYSDRVAPDLDRADDQARREAAELRRKLGVR